MIGTMMLSGGVSASSAGLCAANFGGNTIKTTIRIKNSLRESGLSVGAVDSVKLPSPCLRSQPLGNSCLLRVQFRVKFAVRKRGGFPGDSR